MKKSKVLATTTLAGALLFTAVGATHNAHAAEDQLSDAQIINTANQYIDNQHILLNGSSNAQIASTDIVSGVPEGYTPVAFGEKNSQAPSFIFVNNTTGEVIDRGQGHHVTYTPNHETTTQDKVNKENNNNNTQSTSNTEVTTNNTTQKTTQDTTNNNTQSTDNTQAATNNETTNNEATNNNTTAATDNNVSTPENNTQSTQSNEAQSTAQALPETGGQSNSGLVTIVASVLLAAGSLLAFRRTSNSK